MRKLPPRTVMIDYLPGMVVEYKLDRSANPAYGKIIKVKTEVNWFLDRNQLCTTEETMHIVQSGADTHCIQGSQIKRVVEDTVA